MMFKLQTSFFVFMCDASVDSVSRTSLASLGFLRTTSLDGRYSLRTVFQDIYILVSCSFLSFVKKINRPRHYSV